eukprot:g31903.t1
MFFRTFLPLYLLVSSALAGRSKDRLEDRLDGRNQTNPTPEPQILAKTGTEADPSTYLLDPEGARVRNNGNNNQTPKEFNTEPAIPKEPSMETRTRTQKDPEGDKDGTTTPRYPKQYT